MWILRLLIALLLIGAALLCGALAAGVTADRLGVVVDHPVWRAFVDQARSVDWVQTALWGAAGAFMFIAAIRLLRRTFAFWFFALGIAAFGARWWLMRSNEGGLAVDLAQISSVETARAAAIEASRDYGLVALGALIVLALIILIVDAADRAYWNRRDA